MPNINECGVKVLYPLDVQCSVVNPTTLNSADGSATLLISGGTPPYTILWDNGNINNTINNLMVGEYSASVTDYHGDFIINTTCVLTQPQPTTTTTTTTTTAQPTYTLCMTISEVIGPTTTFTQIKFNPNGLYLGYQSWISQDSVYKLYWEPTITSWKLSGSTMNVISPDPSYPPLNGWELLGGFGAVSVNEGECVLLPVTTFNYTITNPTCTCDGGVIIQATGPNIPFQYSINNGLNWFNNPVFTNLCGGVYPLSVKDSLGNIYSDSATIDSVIPTTQYTLSMFGSFVNAGLGGYLDYTITVNPPLPQGVTIMFDLTLTDVFTRTPYSGSATNNYSYSLLKTNSTIPVTNSTIVNETLTNTLTTCIRTMMYKTTINDLWNDLTISSGDIYHLTASSDVLLNCGTVPSNCCKTDLSLIPTITNPRISGGCSTIVVGATVNNS